MSDGFVAQILRQARVKRMAIFDALPADLREQVNEGLDLYEAAGMAGKREFFEVSRPADGGLQRKSRRA